MDGQVTEARWYYFKRHSLVVRITHWINALAMLILLMSGLQIFNAHPALYWGKKSTFDHPFISLGAVEGPDGNPRGVTEVLGKQFNTDGVLGVSREDGEPTIRGFPSWITLPGYQDLATGRRWHFFFAWILVVNGIVYLGYAILSGHFRDFVPTGPQLRHIGGSIREHLLLRFPKGEEARVYNVLQKIAYFVIIFIAVPLLILAGLTMSPGLNSKFPWVLDLFGGRQSARTVHFLAATLLLLFVIVHIVMVLVSGVWNNMRSMITGRYRIDVENTDAAE